MKTVFIWGRIAKCSDNWHSGGGVVVIADDLKRAIELANAKPGCEIKDDELPDYMVKTIGDEEKVFIFPDAGCC